MGHLGLTPREYYALDELTLHFARVAVMEQYDSW